MERISLPKNVSYLRARDPSIILAGSRSAIEDIRVNLNTELSNTTTSIESEEDNSTIKIYLRIKNGTNNDGLYEISNDTIVSNVAEGSNAARNIKEGTTVKNSYTFTKIFSPEATQLELFNTVIKPKMLSFINGNNATLMTYGASGSGKTFTIIGHDNDPGLVPRSLEYLFKTIPVSNRPKIKPLPNGEINKLNENESKKERLMCTNLLNSSASVRAQSKTYLAMQSRLSDEPVASLENQGEVFCEIWVSYAEIYNEFIYDLLKPEPGRNEKRKKLRLGSSNGQTYIKDLTCVNVSSGLEAFQVIQYGIHNINYASTGINPHSSRSHTIFTIKLVQISKFDDGVYISNFNFCDLAGAERLKKTGNVGKRLKESNNINSSLLVLGRCISAIREGQRNSDKLVPFRESKLTQLFQNALAGQEDIMMIVNVSLKKDMFDETQHVLKFAAIAKDITIESSNINKLKKNGRFSQYLERETDTDVHDNSFAERYLDAINYLEQELINQRIEYEENMRINRESIINGYKEILEDKDRFWKQKLEREIQDLKSEMKEREETIKRQYQLEIKHMQQDFEDQLHRQKMHFRLMMKQLEENRNDVIEIDSSFDESFGSSGDNISLEKQIRILKADNQELMETLEDAKVEYKEAMNTIKEKDKTILKLYDQINDLNYEINVLRNEHLTNNVESGDNFDEIETL